MSKPIIEKPEYPIDRCQAINDVIESIALMETGLSHIINAEGEKIQKVIKWGSDEMVSTEDLLKINCSVEKMISTITKLELILQGKLEIAREFNKECS